MIVQELFSKRNKSFFSWAIRVFTKPLAKFTPFEDIPSHTAVRKGSFVYESTFLSGVRILPFESWKEINTIVGVKERSIPHTDAEFERIFVDIWGKSYDWPGIIFWAIAVIKLVVFNKPIPTVNKWNSPNRYFCSEANGKLFRKDYQMKAPVQLLEQN